MNLTKEDIETYAPKLQLIRHTGALLMWFQQSYYYRGEPEKLKPQLISVTIKNLIFGWWSVVSVFLNPAVTIANWIEFNKYSKEYARYSTSPEQYIFEAKQAVQNGTSKKDKRFKTALIVFLALAGLIALILIISILEAAPKV